MNKTIFVMPSNSTANPARAHRVGRSPNRGEPKMTKTQLYGQIALVIVIISAIVTVAVLFV